jgi:hypothetical protein
VATAGLPPICVGLAATWLWTALDLGSLLDNSPGLGMVGSLRLRPMATWDLRRSLGIRPSLGEPRLLSEDRLELFAAFVTAVAASDIDGLRGDGVSLRLGTLCGEGMLRI